MLFCLNTYFSQQFYLESSLHWRFQDPKRDNDEDTHIVFLIGSNQNWLHYQQWKQSLVSIHEVMIYMHDIQNIHQAC